MILGGLPDRTFARLEAESVIAPRVRGRGSRPSVYELDVIVPAYIEHLRSTAPATGDRLARARRDTSQSELNELRLLEKRKELLPRTQVVADGRAFIAAAKAKLLALPRRLVQAGLLPNEAQEHVSSLVGEALEEMARWRTQVDLLEAANVAA